MTQVIPWPIGSGNVKVTYDGKGNGALTIVSDPNDLAINRSMSIKIKTADGSISVTRTITQFAKNIEHDFNNDFSSDFKW